MREKADGGPSVGRGGEPAGRPSNVTECDNPTSTPAPNASPGGTAPGDRSAAELRDYHAAFTVARTAMALVDREGRLLAANQALGSLLGTAPGRLADRRAADVVALDGDEGVRDAFRDVLRGGRDRLRSTCRLKHPDGRPLWAEVTFDAVRGQRAPAGNGTAALLSVEDVSEHRELAARLRHLEIHDPVTLLPNRTLFFERLEAALRSPGGSRLGICYLDLDGFKAINDTLGHGIGDRLLAAVAGRLLTCVEDGGHLAARLGGDEFALLVEESQDTEQVTALADAVLAALQRPFDIEGHRLTVSASIGVVERPAAGTSPTGLMQAADTTLYWAKADGKGRWTLFDPERNAHRMTRQALSSTLRQAVERREFVLEYQPLVALDSGMLRGVEALVRWEHPQFGRLAPNRFVGLAEEDGSIVQLGRWILAESCRQARTWQQDHPDRPLFVSVNVAVRQVWDSDLVGDVAAILAETGLPPDLLQLELTESAVMGSAGRPLQALHALSEMGVRIVIDDFGTGYSNLAYLSRLPVAALKLDGSFVHGFRSREHPNPADETIVEALVDLAHRLGLTVTAECVESAEQAERLRGIGCDTGQGWFYSRPVAAEHIKAMLGGS
ncbi:putative bifunctional diguanylate cyclase/phosphodiesterase [Streptantibioticus silvisoli]|uniref:EAL domain-containing protein n=1 Tax=Streptantibioticus silvisoli TaxID=2705255 RepID=A0ABT6W9W7_9ACTN|nr:EAL domain-containing protein [Streptantibioticus silvisoli]MDI5967210.1 EAL domain-containing protein [Streptantibioticus silvisoli]